MTLAPGQTLGRYQILEPLGEGGMTTVYKAQQPALDRVVALKFIRSGFLEDREFMERFEREAKAIARLEHPEGRVPDPEAHEPLGCGIRAGAEQPGRWVRPVAIWGRQ